MLDRVSSPLVIVLLVGACRSSSPTPRAPRLERIVPVELEAGQNVTMHGAGFSASNDVAFAAPGGDRIGYVNGARSSDGKQLSFHMPSGFGACAMTLLRSDEGCPSIAILPKSGPYEVWVLHAGGASNRLPVKLEAPP